MGAIWYKSGADSDIAPPIDGSSANPSTLFNDPLHLLNELYRVFQML